MDWQPSSLSSHRETHNIKLSKVNINFFVGHCIELNTQRNIIWREREKERERERESW